MGNCVFHGFGGGEVEVIKVVTSNGGIMEFYSTITVESITNEFPGYGIYKSKNTHFSKPLLHNEELVHGELYYLLPLLNTGNRVVGNKIPITPGIDFLTKSNSNSNSSSIFTPYRMSFDNQGILKRSDSEMIRSSSSGNYSSGGGGVCKVKLVISPEQLSEILSQETSTEALVNSIRTVTKCGNGVNSVSSSDQWSLSSSRKASSTENFFV